MSGETVPRGHCNRCDRCGWTLSDPAYGGCAPGNCSMRTGPNYKTVPPRDTCAGCGKRYGDAPVTPPSNLAALCDELERHDREMTPEPWEALWLGVDNEWICRFADYEDASVLDEQNAEGIAYLRNNAARIASELRRLMRVEAEAGERNRELVTEVDRLRLLLRKAEEVVALARTLGTYQWEDRLDDSKTSEDAKHDARELSIAVYLYDRAATGKS